MSNPKPSVVIIGGGVSGLVALRHLKDVANVVLYECRPSVGGLWSLNKDSDSAIDRCEEGNLFHEKYKCQFRNIFDNLVMNIPPMFAQFKDAPHADDCPPFFTREQFSEYVESYVEKFGLMDNIRLNTFVLDVRQSEDLKENEVAQSFTVETCGSSDRKANPLVNADYVIVANGHNHVPHIPELPGADTFNGKIIHSHDFKDSKDPLYTKKRILVVGTGLSGYEMLAQFFIHPKYGESDVKKVYCSGMVQFLAKTTDFLPWIKKGVIELVESRVSRISKDKVIFQNGEAISVDTIILCTGYKFAFPFLGNEAGLISQSQDGMYYGPLFRKTFCINNPNLCFVGNVDRTCFIQKIMELQCMVVKGVISGKIKLPGKEEMLADLQKDLVNFPEENLRNYFKPQDVSEEDEKIFQDLLELYPELKKYEDFITALRIPGKELFSLFSNGNLIQVRSTEYRQYFPGFKWDST